MSDFETVQLRDAERGCLACGTPAAAADVVTVTSTAILGEPSALTHSRLNLPTAELTRCPTCAARHDACRQVLEQYPALVAAMGSPSVSQHRLEAASDALAALGQPTDRWPTSDAGLRLLIRHLTAPGANARWASLFVPVLTRRASSTEAAAAPWAHLTDDQQHALHTGYAAVLAERAAASAPPTQLPPPSGTACLMCGVGVVELPAAQVIQLGGPLAAADQVWQPINTTLSALGGRAQGTSIKGHLCPLCAHARAQVGATGHAALDRALRAYLRSAGRDEEAEWLRTHDLDDLAGWAALGTSTPNEQPWAHVSLGAIVRM